MNTLGVGGRRKRTIRIPGILLPVSKRHGRLRKRQKRIPRHHVLVAPAFYVGKQEGTNEVQGFSLYTLTQEIPGHPQWSTVSGTTLEAKGFRLPPEGIEPVTSLQGRSRQI